MRSASLTKTLTGIRGFDEITGDGLPRGRTTLVMGGPGPGKTVFAPQSLINGVRQMKKGSVFVVFEESTREIVANAATCGRDLPALATIVTPTLLKLLPLPVRRVIDNLNDTQQVLLTLSSK